MRTFLGEMWYNVSFGVPYLDAVAFGPAHHQAQPSGEILGRLPSMQYMKTKIMAAAATVPGVSSLKCFLTGPDRQHRTVGGQIQISDSDGVLLFVETASLAGVPPWYVSGTSPEASV